MDGSPSSCWRRESAYQLSLAARLPSASIAYDRATSADEPIVFTIGSFAAHLPPASISTPAVTDQSCRGSMDWRRSSGFKDSKFQIRSNRDRRFLDRRLRPPPSTISSATRRPTSRLQFELACGDSLKLLAGSAKLQTPTSLASQRKHPLRFRPSTRLGPEVRRRRRLSPLFHARRAPPRYSPDASDDSVRPPRLVLRDRDQLVDCPLTGQHGSVIAKHVSFLIELPKKISFSLAAVASR